LIVNLNRVDKRPFLTGAEMLFAPAKCFLFGDISVKQPKKASMADLKQLSEELALEASIANSRAEIIEANYRKLKTQQDFNKLRASIKR